MSWERLSKTYKRRGITLAFGAGTSKMSGIPDWKSLLLTIANSQLGKDGESLVKKMLNCNFDIPTITASLKIRIENELERTFADVVRDALYKDFLQQLNNKNIYNSEKPCDGFDRKEFARFISEKNPILASSGSLCVKHDDIASKECGHPGTPAFANSKIHAIVNFNLDSIFREYMDARYQPILVRTIERPSKRPEPGRIPIYHVHGFLQFRKERQTDRREAKDKTVLSEEDYFERFNDPTSFFNSTMMHLLGSHSFLFVGLSMKDVNLRRLLYYSTKERVNAYEEEGRSSPHSDENVLMHYTIQRKESDEFDRSMEDSLRKLGTTVLWVDDYLEIPDRIRQLYCSTGDKWEAVA